MGAKKWSKDKEGNDKTGLTIKEQDFVRMYCFGEPGVRNNGAEAYKQSFGLKETIKRENIWVYASVLMSKGRIKDAIKEALAVYDENWVIQRLAEEATTKSNKGAERVRATELVGKSRGMFVERVEQTIKVDGILMGTDEGLEE